MIKLLDFIHYKGGVRIHMQCGLDAVDDFNEKYDNVSAIAASLSVKQCDAAAAVARQGDVIAAQKQTIAELKRELVRAKLALVAPSEDGLLLFEPSLDMDGLRALAEVRRACAAASARSLPNATARDTSMRQRRGRRTCARLRGELNAALAGRGGGSGAMIQGSAAADADTIRAFSRRTARKSDGKKRPAFL